MTRKQIEQKVLELEKENQVLVALIRNLSYRLDKLDPPYTKDDFTFGYTNPIKIKASRAGTWCGSIGNGALATQANNGDTCTGGINATSF